MTEGDRGATGPYRITYCVDCEWFVSTETHTRSEQSALAIGHYLETEYGIDNGYRKADESTSGWTDKWPPSE
jgi:hypothetical protein